MRILRWRPCLIVLSLIAQYATAGAGIAAAPVDRGDPRSNAPTRAEYQAPVGASPERLRAGGPVELYDPPVQPVYDLTKRSGLPPISSEEEYLSWMRARTDQQESFLRRRWNRAKITVAQRLVSHTETLRALLVTPREWFVRTYNLSKTYDYTALPIGYGQTISGPGLVAHMTDELDVLPHHRVLEIGTGSGYQSAVLAELSNYVYTIEIVKPLAEETNRIYEQHTEAMPEYANIHRRIADGYYGWPKYTPFDRIIVTTGIDHIPPELLKQLSIDGIMLIPIGPPSGQVVLKITKTQDAEGNIRLTREDIYRGVRRQIFVPFTASGGGTHNDGAGR